MKLAKKMLACVMALALVAVLGLTAFAATPVVSGTATDAYVGQEVNVTVSVTGFTGAEDGTIFFNFDPEVLEFVSVSGASVTDISAVSGLVKDSTDQVSYAFMFAESSAVDSTELVYLTFNVLKAGDASITFTCDSWDGVDTPAGGTIAITATEEPETTTAEPTTAAPTTEPADVEPTSATAPTTKSATTTPVTGSTTAIAAVAGVMAIAAVAFVATRKKDEE